MRVPLPAVNVTEALLWSRLLPATGEGLPQGVTLMGCLLLLTETPFTLPYLHLSLNVVVKSLHPVTAA